MPCGLKKKNPQHFLPKQIVSGILENEKKTRGGVDKKTEQTLLKSRIG